MKIAPDSWILMIETSQRDGSVAMGTLDGNQIDVECFSPGLVHGKELQPRIDALVERNDARGKLSVMAVSAGPGSFTGTRIGVSAAKAMAWALEIPALAISSFDVIACNIEEPGRWGVLLDASSGDLDIAFYEVNADGASKDGEERTGHRDQLADFAASGTRFIGSGNRIEGLVPALPTGPVEWDQPIAQHGLRLAIARVQQILDGAPPPAGWDSPHSLNPRYLRVSRAEEVRRRRLAGEEQA